jgi:hypothetical protein
LTATLSKPSQGAIVEWAGAVAAPHELTRGWSFTALSRARARPRLFVLGERDAPGITSWRRDEHARGEREEKLTPNELAARVARYKRTSDDEDLVGGNGSGSEWAASA